MMQRKLLLAALAVSSIGLMPLPASAAVSVYLDVAPPAPRHEVLPAPRHGYAWQPGFWEWRGDRHRWRKGYWVREREGYYFHPSRWEQPTVDGYLERSGCTRAYAMRIEIATACRIAFDPTVPRRRAESLRPRP